MPPDRRTLPASNRTLPHGATRVAGTDPTERITLSLYLKPLGREAEQAGIAGHADARQALNTYRATAHEPQFARLRAFAQAHNLKVEEENPGRRLIRLSGTVENLQTAFGTQLAIYEHNGKQFRGRTGLLSMPQEIANDIESVQGLDTRPIASPHFIHPAATAATITAHLPNQIGQLYTFPQSLTGQGPTHALIELGGGYNTSDTASAFAAMNLPTPTVTAISVDGGQNTPGGQADAEVALDIQVAGANAPAASIAVYFAPNTTQGFIDAVSQAAHDATTAPHIISISWGAPESAYAQQDLESFTSTLQDAATLGLSVFVASGDNLATDGLADGQAHTDFPASSPYAIGCGGTTIDVTGNQITTETVWNSGSSGTGGGISDIYPVPAFQQSISLPPSVNDGATRRGVPDVAGNADAASGYTIVLNGQSIPVGGTSAVAPLWAALTALLNQARTTAGQPTLGFFLSTLYANPQACNDITMGNNIAGTIGYTAGPGWDACTGLGSPNGAALATLFAPSAPGT